MATPDDDDQLLRSVSLRNAKSIMLARQRVEEELLQAKTTLEGRTEALAQSLAMMRATLESTTDAILVTDETSRVTVFNQKFVEMWATPSGVIETMQHAQLLEVTSRQFKEPQLVRARIEEIHATSPSETFDLLELCDGRVFERYSKVQRVDDRDVGRVWSFRDITERRSTEQALRESGERMRFMAESMPQKIFTALPDGEINYFNQQWLDFSGLTLEQLQDWHWVHFMHPDDLDENTRLWQHSISTGEPFRLECRFRQADGVYRWHLCGAHAMRDATGKVLLWTGSCTDIDDLKRAAEERKHLFDSERSARTEAERTSRMKDEFLATLSHELRTPLNAILGWSQVLRRGDKSGETLEQGLDTIERNARMQARLIEDLLDMNRIMSGKMRLDVQLIEPVGFVNDAVETTRPSAEAKGIRLETMLDPAAGPIPGDPKRLQQVVWNLLSNAIKFTPKGGRVLVTLKRINSHIEICVADNGMGISEDFLPHVFERFRQSDSSTTRSHGGLGLGLSIVKHLIELHGGTVRVESPGKARGTTFTAQLPMSLTYRAQDLEQAQAAKASGVALRDFRRPDLTGIKVLAVDDDVDACILIRRVLSECGAVVLTTNAVIEALRLVEQEMPHVIVSDIGMPEVDGYEFLRLLRALERNKSRKVPVIALTAFARSEDRTRSLLAGFAVHLAKPVEPAELVATVASVVGRTDKADPE